MLTIHSMKVYKSQFRRWGIRKNLNIGLGYMEAWIRGIGCVPINFLMYVT